MADWVEVVGAFLIVLGIALYAFPVALIVTGLFLVLAANSRPYTARGSEATRPTRTGR